MINITNITNANTTIEIFKATNDASGGGLFVLILTALFFIILLSLRSQDIKAVLMLDSFIITIVGILAFIMGLIMWQILIIPILMLLGSIIIYKFVD